MQTEMSNLVSTVNVAEVEIITIIKNMTGGDENFVGIFKAGNFKKNVVYFNPKFLIFGNI